MNTQNDYARIEKAIRFIRENYTRQPRLDEIAEHIHLSKFHFQRLFIRWAGISPKKFIGFLTVEHASRLLGNGYSTLDTSYELGLSGNGRLHDLFIAMTAATPGQVKNKGELVQISYCFFDSLFGKALLAETKLGICDLQFIENEEIALFELLEKWPRAEFNHAPTPQLLLVKAFFTHFELKSNTKIQLDLRGTDFQINVWKALLKIPFGQLTSYSAIAKEIGKPNAVRAVGTAIGSNPVAFLIPCHRVIRQAGSISNYRWGADRKMALIAYESGKKYAGFPKEEDE